MSRRDDFLGYDGDVFVDDEANPRLAPAPEEVSGPHEGTLEIELAELRIDQQDNTAVSAEALADALDKLIITKSAVKKRPRGVKNAALNAKRTTGFFDTDASDDENPPPAANRQRRGSQDDAAISAWFGISDATGCDEGGFARAGTPMRDGSTYKFR